MQTATAKPIEFTQRANDLIDEQEAADFLKLSTGTLSVWRSTGRYAIPFIKVGRRVRYSRASLIAWLESRTRTNGATA
jgi:excisionase family DNA binding protein